jgi:hypothetical protein
LKNCAWLNCAVPRATLGIKKLQYLAERFRIRGVAKKSALAPYLYEAFVFELVEMVGKGRVRNVQFFLDLIDDQAIRVRGQ